MTQQTDVRVKVNSFDSAKSISHARRMSQQMYGANTFFATGVANLVGDDSLQLLDPIFLDGLGELWSAAYTAVEIKHRISDGGWKMEVTCYSNSLTGDENTKTQAQAIAETGGTPLAESKIQFKRTNGKITEEEIPTNANAGAGG